MDIDDLITLIVENDHKKDDVNRGAYFPLTDIYNEGWLLRLALNRGLLQKELKCKKDEKWFSEAELKSPFLHGKLRETRTHADAVMGSFRFEKKTSTGVEIDKDSFSFFYAIEAKVYAPLSKGISKCDYFNQAARYIGCLAKMAFDAGLCCNDFGKLGLFVVTPESQGKKIKEDLSIDNLRKLLTRRISEYEQFSENLTDEFVRWKMWWDEKNEVFLHSIHVTHIDWEKIINDELSSFYQKCLDYNKRN